MYESFIRTNTTKSLEFIRILCFQLMYDNNILLLYLLKFSKIYFYYTIKLLLDIQRTGVAKLPIHDAVLNVVDHTKLLL